jgi:predicted KAP-like P-loop ATPase
MIKHAVRKHFDGVDDQMVTSYFDKLIQVPIRVPPLGTQEVRAYMMMLFIDNSDLPDTDKDRIRAEVCKQLGQSWQGKRVDRAFLETLHARYPPSLLGQLDTAERLAPIMTGASGIVGNPRLVKRFLNAVSIRLAIARAQGIDIDQAALAKMLLFERYGSGQAYGELIASVSASAEGKPSIISEWEETVAKSAEPALSGVWDTAFVKEWLSLPPRLGDMDLRGILYVSREHAPLITPEDRLSSVAVDLLTALLTHPETASIHSEALGRLSRPETTVIMDRLLDRARREQEWGAPPILDACLALAQGDANLGQRLAAFLRDRPVAQLAPSIVPKIGDQPWAKSVFDKWEGEAAKPLKNAIKSWRADGDVAI